jgi:hypothetical protein
VGLQGQIDHQSFIAKVHIPGALQLSNWLRQRALAEQWFSNHGIAREARVSPHLAQNQNGHRQSTGAPPGILAM